MTPSSALAVGDVARYGDVATILRSAADPKSVPTFVDRAPLDGKAKARATAQDFEAVFLNSMLQHMFAGLDGEGPFGGSGAAGVWRSFLSEEYAKSFAKSGGIGLANDVYRSLLAHQETSVR